MSGNPTAVDRQLDIYIPWHKPEVGHTPGSGRLRVGCP